MRALSILKSFAVWRIAIPALIPAAFLVSSASRYLSEDGGSVPRFEREVLPILQANCVTCHGEKLKKNGLDLRTLDSLLKGGESGPAVTPGSAKDSLLFRKISAGEMPFRGTKLSQEKIDLIGRWIQAGALHEGEDVDASRKQLTAAQDRLKVPHFESEVLPIFQENCLVCHGETMKQKGLDLRTRQTALKGGESGPAIVQGAAKDSLLFQKILSGVMPPGDKKLSAEKVELLRRWIDSGALKLGEEAQASKGPTPKPVTEQEAMVNVFEARCITCHGKWQRDGGLDLRTRASLLQGGPSGPAIVPGKPEESLAYKLIQSGQMPPPVPKGSPHYVRAVEAGEIDKLRQWITAGAPGNTEELAVATTGADPLVSDDARKFWSFQPPKRSAIPAVHHRELVRTPIDAFLLEKLETKNLTFAPEANRLALMRRLYFDLIGLPPVPGEVEAYLKDVRPDAYERMVDRLLASPHYGERWGKYWLDGAGYADSHGKIDRDTIRPYAWRYRDYVIRSLNADKSYDRFLVEQIAGDELFDYKVAKVLTPEQRDDLIATGFLRTAADDTDEAVLNLVPYRMSVLADEVNIFSSAVMGLTMECARCHSHKYDPIPQRDYYRFTAILQSAYDPYDWRVSNNVTYAGAEGQVELPPQFQRFILDASDPDSAKIDAYNAPIRTEIAHLEATLNAKAALLNKQIREEKLSKIPESLRADVRKALDDPQEKRTPLEKYLVQKFEPSLKVERQEVEERFKDFKEEAAKTRKAIQEVKARLKPEPKIQALFDTGGEPSPTYILRRGDYRNPGARVTPGVPSALRDGIAPYGVVKPSWTTDTTGRRLALARWLVQPNHPLTARVMVNRLWLHHFGAGLVATSGNFGKTGAPPLHPQLLDWLATEFVRQGWSLKAMHRLIVTSTAYRQSSIAQPAQVESDPDDVLLSRFPLRRLDAEAIRDSILKVTGRLDARQFGPADEVDLTPEGEVISKGTGFRRSIYLLQRRSMPLTLLELFDAPRMDPSCLERARSTVPAQALQLWNSEMLREGSRYFGGRVMEEVGDDVDKEIDQVYLTALSRWPTSDERNLGRQALRDLTKYWLEHLEKDIPAEPRPAKARWLALANFCHTILNSAEFIYID